MTDRPIIFSAPMVLALLAGRKTQTRRLTSSSLVKAVPEDRLWVRENHWLYGQWRELGLDVRTRRARRTFDLIGRQAAFEMPDQISVYDGAPGWTFRPAMHLPRWASRLTLVVTDVRRQRLQEISEEDAIAEGSMIHADGHWLGLKRGSHDRPQTGAMIRADGYNWFGSLPLAGSDARGAFYCLWQSLHGAESWAVNPDVIAITFAILHRNIDRMEAA